MSEKINEAWLDNDSELDAVNGGVTIKPDSGWFAATYGCTCGCEDFIVISANPSIFMVQCKKCGKQSAVYNK